MTLVVAIAGPFGTFGAQSLVWRLIYWGLLIAVAISIAVFLRFFWRSILIGKPDLAARCCGFDLSSFSDRPMC
jgi:hypothetical protein